ncbi:hypothetical protein MTO96_037051 [Rhipicephalus appendiculatus]
MSQSCCLKDADKLYTAGANDVAAKYGKKYTWELKKRVMGLPDTDAARIVIDALGLPIEEDYYLAEMDRLFTLTLPESKIMPGAEQLIRHLHAHGIPTAATTSSKAVPLDLKMTHHGDLLSIFHHVVVSGRDPEVQYGKPHPGIFLVAASKFDDHPTPEKVLVFEDSPAGVTAALEAGMQVVMIPDPQMDQDNRSRATLCIDSLLQFKPELFGLPSIQDVSWTSSSHSGSTTEKKKTAATASSFKKVTHVIFDADGLLLDSEKLYTAAAETMASRYGKKYTWELNKQMMGAPAAEAARMMIKALALPLTPEEYMAAVDPIYEKIFPDVQLMPGAERLVRHLHTHAVPMAIATGSKPSSFNLKMTHHQDFLALFHHTLCLGGEPEVKRGKPYPDIFLVTASKFDEKPPPEKVLVFEDSVKGVAAARAAHMQVVMVPDPRIEKEDRRKATICISSLLEFKPELFGLPAFDAPVTHSKESQQTSSRPSSMSHPLVGHILCKQSVNKHLNC